MTLEVPVDDGISDGIARCDAASLRGRPIPARRSN